MVKCIIFCFLAIGIATMTALIACAIVSLFNASSFMGDDQDKH